MICARARAAIEEITFGQGRYGEASHGYPLRDYGCLTQRAGVVMRQPVTSPTSAPIIGPRGRRFAYGSFPFFEREGATAAPRSQGTVGEWCGACTGVRASTPPVVPRCSPHCHDPFPSGRHHRVGCTRSCPWRNRLDGDEVDQGFGQHSEPPDARRQSGLRATANNLLKS